MARFKIQKGDRIEARSPAIVCENTFSKIGGHVTYGKYLTVTKVFSHGVRTRELGYVHNNNILSRVEE